MAGSVNKVIIVGRLGGDPEVRYTANGSAVANFSVATDEYQGKGKESRTEWHRIVAWGKTAEICKEYLTKGRQVYIEGRLQTREWEGREGKRYTTEIVANEVVFLGSTPHGGGPKGERPRPVETRQDGGGGGFGEDIPF